MNKLIVSTSPHIAKKRSVTMIMLEVVIALIPATVASIFFYGFYALFLELISVGAAVGAEALFNVITKQKQTIKDCSAIVTGLLLALNLPVSVPFYVPIVGSAFAIIFVKMLFGGLGKNFANPAITGRIFLLLAWSSLMTTFVKPIDWMGGAPEMFKYFNCILRGSSGLPDVSAVTIATPLSAYSIGSKAVRDLNFFNLFIGNIGGSMGEVNVLALLVGAVYLIVRRIIDWRIPLTFVGTVAVFAIVYGAVRHATWDYLISSVFGGGLLLGAIFMATDYATTPNTHLGVTIYAFGCGIITALIRFYGNYPEGVSFAILLMNIVTPYIDKMCKVHPFGYKKAKA